MMAINTPTVIFDFNPGKDLGDWYVLDDGVMGGLSLGNLCLTKDGHGLYTGNISLENYGGFSSIRCSLQNINCTDKTKISFRVKGDGKKYQFRIKHDSYDYHSYVHHFKTKNEWEEITLYLEDFYPSFRGRTINMENFNHDSFEEISILIGNKKEESFKLEIDYIHLQ